METKKDRFVRLAESRTNKLLNIIRLLENLSAPTYEYSLAQVDQIFNAIRSRLDKAEQTLRMHKMAPTKKRFSLSEPYYSDEELVAMRAPHWVIDSQGSYYCSHCGTPGKGDAPDAEDRHCRYCGITMSTAVKRQDKTASVKVKSYAG